MNRYEEYVKVIRQVIGMDVEVIYDDINANCGGSAYAGFIGYEDYIVPSDFWEQSMFDMEDFLTQEHLHYYHVGLPSHIRIPSKDKAHYGIMNEILSSAGVEYTQTNYELFVILHEFGHAHYLFSECKGDLASYLHSKREADFTIYCLKELSSQEQQRQYRLIPTEKYADEFAKTHIHEVLKLLSEQQGIMENIVN